MESAKLNRLIRIARHPAGALAASVLFAIAASFFVRSGIAARDRIATANDPVAISDQALAEAFDGEVAEHEIQAALAAGDIDLAQSFVALAAERSVPIDAALAGNVERASADQGSIANTAGRFVHGLWTGEPTDIASLAGTAVGDLFVFGDIRDAAREGTRYLTGQHYDPWILGLAGVGIAITGRAAIVLTAGALELATWLLWAALALLGFCSLCKAAVERITQRSIDRRKLRCGIA